ncbi:MAG TPA: DsbA family protein [Micromonosporaceae bacterium]|nr:DsbA family protein [Micromonosporaceae bacterium]
MSERTVVDMWFDPACPWAWLTSRWLLELEKVRPVDVRFHVMSLSVLNAGRTLSEDYQRLMERSLGAVRVCAAAEHRYGADVLRTLYTALGLRIHVHKEEVGPDLYAGALTDAGLDPALAAAATRNTYDDVLRASHEAGMSLVGNDVGTPVLHFPGPDGQVVGFFGPVVTPAPRGEAAGALWDGLRLMAATPGFYELKRSRERGPIFD